MYPDSAPLQNTFAPSCRSIEDFEIIEQVGEGHLSAVLHCVDVRSGIHVAVKSYHKDRMNLMRLLTPVCMFLPCTAFLV